MPSVVKSSSTAGISQHRVNLAPHRSPPSRAAHHGRKSGLSLPAASYAAGIAVHHRLCDHACPIRPSSISHRSPARRQSTAFLNRAHDSRRSTQRRSLRHAPSAPAAESHQHEVAAHDPRLSTASPVTMVGSPGNAWRHHRLFGRFTADNTASSAVLRRHNSQFTCHCLFARSTQVCRSPRSALWRRHCPLTPRLTSSSTRDDDDSVIVIWREVKAAAVSSAVVDQAIGVVISHASLAPGTRVERCLQNDEQ